MLVGCASTSEAPRPTGDSLVDIVSAANNIDKITENNKEVSTQTDIIRTEAERVEDGIDQINEEFSKTKNELAKEKEASNKAYKHVLTSILIASGLSVSVLLLLFFTGHLKSTLLLIIAAGLALGAITLLGINKYLEWIAGGYAAIILGFIVYIGVGYRRSVKANIELVETTEKLKPIVGSKIIAEQANPIQSKNTKKIVDTVQKKIGVK